jgi:hypothetical protein
MQMRGASVETELMGFRQELILVGAITMMVASPGFMAVILTDVGWLPETWIVRLCLDLSGFTSAYGWLYARWVCGCTCA